MKQAPCQRWGGGKKVAGHLRQTYQWGEGRNERVKTCPTNTFCRVSAGGKNFGGTAGCGIQISFRDLNLLKVCSNKKAQSLQQIFQRPRTPGA